MLKFIKDWTLPLAMLTGAVTYPWISYAAVFTPWLIFMMLLLTFSKLSPRDIRIRPAHIWLLMIQIFGCIGVYGLLSFFHPVVAQGGLICVLVSTATSAAVITGMLGGNVAFLTSYLLVCNIAVAVAAPLVFPFIVPGEEVSFLSSFLVICKQVGPVLLLPLLLAWFFRYYLPKVHEKIVSIRGLSFYLWAVALTIVTGSMVRFLVQQENPDYSVEISLAVVALVICVGQFLLGRRIGTHYGDAISSGQGWDRRIRSWLFGWLNRIWIRSLPLLRLHMCYGRIRSTPISYG